ncbi:Chloride channel ClC-plant, partial [Cynara cardunculus var. scolymus]
YYQAFAAFAGCNLVLAICAAVLCAYIAPAAAGSGIPEIFGSVFGVAAGFVVGKEGPMVHTGACIASLLGQGGSRKYHLTWKWLRYFKNDRDRRDLITCGAAAGVAAAFRAPVGGCGLFGEGGLIMFDINSSIPDYNMVDLLAVMLLGVVGGILGSLYNYLVDKVLRTYSIVNERGPVFRVFLVVIISLLTSCCAYGVPWFAKCIPCPTGLEVDCPTAGRSGNYKNFQCPPDHYNDLASLLLNTNDDAIRSLFSSLNANEFRIPTLLVFFTAMYILGIITYGIAIPSGLFIPVILAGASYGRFIGKLLVSISNLDVGLFALLGAASFLGGTMRMTVSLCVILLELTNNLLMLPLMMLVLLISKSVADNFNKGVYDQIVRMKGLPFLEAHAEPYMRHLVAGDVVSGPLITFSGVEKVGNIVHSLRLTTHNGFPVIDEPPFLEAPELCGIVLRSHLIVLLKGKMFTKHKCLTGTEMLQRFHAFDFAKAGLGKGPKMEDLDIKPEEMDLYVDLHPITNTSPYTVVETMSLAKAAVAFRELGLRHLCVVPKTPGRPPVVGILTRHDFMPQHILALYPGLDPHKKN